MTSLYVLTSSNYFKLDQSDLNFQILFAIGLVYIHVCYEVYANVYVEVTFIDKSQPSMRTL